MAIFMIICLIGTIVEGSEIKEEAEATLKKAANYFYGTVATNGGYLWKYSKDLKKREGEGKATNTQIWVQPPGTPAVGFAYLKAYEATGDNFYLEAATSAADALIWGQLESGGWDYKIDFDPDESKKWYYRHDKGKVDPKNRRNYSVFDDNNTQSALRFLMAVHKITGDEKYWSAIEYGLSLMQKSQFDNGAWPQVYPLPPKGYSGFYTFNDGVINDCVAVMLDAYHLYNDERYLNSAKLAGDFIIASQLPEPQAGWAQQYSYDMKPAPARWFEPASVCSSVTSRNIKTLVELYLETGYEKYLKPIPSAIKWLKNSMLKDGNWARFYEIGTNKPIYVNMNREIVYEFINIRPGYSWVGEYGVEKNIELYEKVIKFGREKYLSEINMTPKVESSHKKLKDLESKVIDIINSIDDQGRWIDNGYILCSTFIKNVQLLSDYISLANKE